MSERQTRTLRSGKKYENNSQQKQLQTPKKQTRKRKSSVSKSSSKSSSSTPNKRVRNTWTYQALNATWIESPWIKVHINESSPNNDDDDEIRIPDQFSVTLDDLVSLNITKRNYKDIINLADYIQVINVDPIVDKIVDLHQKPDIVKEFGYFYRFSERLKKLTRKTLDDQIKDYNRTITKKNGKIILFKKYGHCSFWDVSDIVNMKGLFERSAFKGDISNWNVSKVTTMENMFAYAKFNGDISNWNVSNVTDMNTMFYYSKFNGDISNWNVSKVTTMKQMFCGSEFNKDISNWNVSNVKNMEEMFAHSKDFNQDISNWNVSKPANVDRMFINSEFKTKYKYDDPRDEWKGDYDDSTVYDSYTDDDNANYTDDPNEYETDDDSL